MGKLYFRYGAMNCGKSTALMQVAHNYYERGMNAVVMKPETDSKGQGKVVSRLGIDKEVHHLIGKSDNILSMIQRRTQDQQVHCILVDEAQFLTRTQVDQLFEVAVVLDIPVICYGLRTDFLMNGFEGSERLLLLAHSLEEQKTICTCGKKAMANARKINGTFVFEGEQVAIDGEDNVEYEPLCAACYFKYKNGEKPHEHS